MTNAHGPQQVLDPGLKSVQCSAHQSRIRPVPSRHRKFVVTTGVPNDELHLTHWGPVLARALEVRFTSRKCHAGIINFHLFSVCCMLGSVLGFLDIAAN